MENNILKYADKVEVDEEVKNELAITGQVFTGVETSELEQMVEFFGTEYLTQDTRRTFKNISLLSKTFNKPLGEMLENLKNNVSLKEGESLMNKISDHIDNLIYNIKYGN